MEMPIPTAEHRRLQQLAGDWIGDVSTRWAPKGDKACDNVRARMGLDGFYLLVEGECACEGQVFHRGLTVIGYDPRGRCYTANFFDTCGMDYGAAALGTWDGDELVFQHEMNHCQHTRLTYRIGRDQYALRVENSADGKAWSTSLEGTYRRAGAPPSN
jgi:hypothetical protein